MIARKVLKVVAFPSLLLAGHSAYVYNERIKRNERVQEQKNNPLAADFRVGTADDLIMDNLQTGDVIIFKRKWYQHYFPMALALVCYRALFNCDYDHVGIVLTDKTGKTYILENTPFNGVRSRLFSDRISYSQASSITLVPLVPREMKLSIQPLTKAQPKFLTYPSEFSELVEASRRKFLQKYLGGSSSGQSVGLTSSEEALCPNIRFLGFVYHHLGIELETTSQKNPSDVNLHDILDHNEDELQMRRLADSGIPTKKSESGAEDVNHYRLKFDPAYLQIRSR